MRWIPKKIIITLTFKPNQLLNKQETQLHEYNNLIFTGGQFIFNSICTLFMQNALKVKLFIYEMFCELFIVSFHLHYNV